MRRCPIRLALPALLMLTASDSFGQLKADHDFDPHVARPAYTREHPRVLIDEAHHNFYTAGGRLKPFADLIASDGYQASPGTEPFTRETLRKADVLVVANARGARRLDDPDVAKPAFTEGECEAVREWVEAGGSLLLIADAYPMGPAADGLAGRFGVEMSRGVTFDRANSGRGGLNLLFTRENELLGDHPIMVGRGESERIGRVQSFGGRSLKGPPGGVALLKLSDTAIDRTIPGGKGVAAAGRCQGMALVYGKGRVVILGDAAMLSAQVAGPRGVRIGMNVPGIDNRQLALNVMHWLSGLIGERP